MFQMPMSSPMMTTMFGLCGCCAAAGMLTAVTAMNKASRPSPMFLNVLMV